MRIRTRDDLLKAIAATTKLRTQRYALVEGTVEVLGGFSELPPSPRPGWIVRLTSRYGRRWLIGVHPDARSPVLRVLDAVPWEWWIGRDSANPLYCGDNPDEYARLRDRWLEEPDPVVAVDLVRPPTGPRVGGSRPEGSGGPPRLPDGDGGPEG